MGTLKLIKLVKPQLLKVVAFYFTIFNSLVKEINRRQNHKTC